MYPFSATVSLQPKHTYFGQDNKLYYVLWNAQTSPQMKAKHFIIAEHSWT